jgi:hypothetical protein
MLYNLTGPAPGSAAQASGITAQAPGITAQAPGGDAAAGAAAGFEDANPAAWYADAVTWAKEAGLVLGEKTESGYAFRPNDGVTRQEIAAILERYAHIAKWPPYAEGAAGTATPAITSAVSPATPASTSAPGNASGATTPTGPVTSASGAATSPAPAPAFADGAGISPYASASVAYMQELGILSGVANPDGSFSFLPRQGATRAEAAKMLSMLVMKAFF